MPAPPEATTVPELRSQIEWLLQRLPARDFSQTTTIEVEYQNT